MKTRFKLQLILFIVLFISNHIFSQVTINTDTNNASSTTLTLDQLTIDSEGWWSYEWVINVSPNTPVKFTYNLNTNNYFRVYTEDNGYWNNYLDIAETGGPESTGAITIISTTGKIYVSCSYGYNGNIDDPICSFQTTTDLSYPVNAQSTLFQKDLLISGKVGIDIAAPREKLDVNGSAIISQRLTIGTSNNSLSKISAYNNTNPYTLYSNTYLNSSSSVYGLYSNAINPTGNVYGIYSSVAGQTGKKWAGYFTGGNVAVVNGNMGIGVDNPLGILHVRGTYDNAWIYFASNAGFTSAKPKLGYGLAFTWNYSGSAEESIINYSGSQNARLDFTSWDGTNLTTEMTLKKGKLGIGTILPNAKFQIGNSYSDTGNPVMRIAAAPSGSNGVVTDALHIDTQGGANFNQGIAITMGTQTTTYGEYTSRIIHYGNTGGTRASKLQLQTHSVNQGVWNTGLLIDEIGYVGIGTTTPDELLTVKGIIHAQEVKIDMNGALVPDYVFDASYKLMPLSEVEQFVNTNKHLPEIPSATEVQKNGLSVGEMQNKLLQKIEELTLYVIEQQKQIEELKAQIVK